MNFTNEEKEFLKMLFNIGQSIINAQDGFFDFDGVSFSENDFFELKEKLGVYS